MLGNLQIYRKESEPRDRESFLWIHTDEDGNTVAQVYTGAGWLTIASSGGTGGGSSDKMQDLEVCCEVNSTRIAEHEVAIKDLQESGGEQGGSIIEVSGFDPISVASQSDLDAIGLTVNEIQAAAQGKRTGLHLIGTIPDTTTTYDTFYRILSADYQSDGQAYSIYIGLWDENLGVDTYYRVWHISYSQSDGFSSRTLPVINGGGDDPQIAA